MPRSDQPLLQTKFHIAGDRRDRIRRSRLLERLDMGLGRKLTLVTAPAGFGKSALLCDWMRHIEETSDDSEPRRVAWLTIDEFDNDRVRFLRYLLGAIESGTSFHGAGENPVREPVELLQSPQPPSSEEILTPLVNQLARLEYRIILVIDDYQVIESESVHNIMRFIIDRIPPSLHIVIAARDDPPLPLARYRARNEMLEIRGTDLRFTSLEASEFFRTMKLDLTPEQISALEHRTEGWIAGLQLAALSLEGCEDIDGRIASFTGSHRHVMDYLLHEVLDRLSEDLTSFLLETSILDRLCGSLCNAVTGGYDGQNILEELERANLFLIPLDDERRWYRYHRLFSELLVRQLTSSGTDVTELHHRAAAWLCEQGLIDEAIEHVFDIKDYEEAGRLLELYTEHTWDAGDSRIWRWIEQLPEAERRKRPYLGILRAYCRCVSGFDNEDIGRAISEAAEAIDACAGDTGLYRGRLAAVLALVDSYHGDLGSIIRHSEEALATLPKSETVWRSLVSIALGDFYGYLGDMPSAMRARLQALESCRTSGSVYYEGAANLKVAITLREQGDLRETAALCERQLEVVRRAGLAESILAGWTWAVLGEVRAELGETEEAYHMALRGSKLTAGAYNLAVAGWATMCLVRVLYSVGRLDEADRVIETAFSVPDYPKMPTWIYTELETWRCRILISRGPRR